MKSALVAQICAQSHSSLMSFGSVWVSQQGRISKQDTLLSNLAEHVKPQVERTNVGRPAFAGQSPMAGTRGGRWNR